jgi:superfamily I DNA/RNA helicase
MPFKAFLPAAFSHTHENVMFDALVQTLTNEFHSHPQPHYLIGNMLFENEDFDAILIKPNAICVVEMKNYGGMIHFSENGPWFADEIEVKGNAKGNPYRQVRGCRFSLMNYLEKRQSRFLQEGNSLNWGHVSCMVLFGKAIQFDEQLPGTLGRWFHICDMSTVAATLSPLSSLELRLSSPEQSSLLRSLEITDAHHYRSGIPTGAGHSIPSASTRPKRFKIAYHKDSRFRDAQNQMRQAGTAKSQGVVRVLALMEQVRKGINAFSVIPSRNDVRIADSVIYAINEQCELAGIRSEETFYPFFIGDPEEIESWMAANEGLVLTVDGATKRITTTIVSPEQAERTLQPAAPTTENVPFFRRVSGLDLPSLVPTGFIRKALERLDEKSEDAEIVEVLESVAVQDVRKFLHDVMNLVRAGDVPGAEARVRLRKGEACPIVDAASVESDALVNDENSDQIVIINGLDDRQMAQLLDPRHFQEWMLFLHPDQKRLAEADFDRPLVLTGVSGSGKTCILVHRARYLARKYPGERIAVMTLNRALADLLRNLVRQLCTEAESANIKVMAFYDYFSELLHTLGPDRYLEQLQELAPENENLKNTLKQANRKKIANDIDARSGETSEETWDDFYDQKNDAVRNVLEEVVKTLEARRIDACRYLREECTLVRSALTLSERARYLNGEDFKREGRAIPFLPSVRRDVLKILVQFEEWMVHGAVLDVVELTQAVTPLWQDIRKLGVEHRFRCLLVDEFQDFSTLDLRLLVHVPTHQENGLFLAGDTVQKILVKRLNMTDAGLARGSATHRQIKKNYRNSRQILRAASKLANHYASQANAQGEEIEILDPELATRETNPPIALKTNNAIRKAWEIAMECLKLGSSNPWTVCIATAAPELFSVESILKQKPKGMRAEPLSGDCINNPETLVVGTMQNLKGFEFTLVLLVGCEAGAIPSPGIPPGESWREALRLYVAMTRARDQVYLIYEQKPSEFLQVMNGEIVNKEEPETIHYETEPVQRFDPPSKPQMPLRSGTHSASEQTDFDPEESCEAEFDKAESDLLHTYFAQFVYGKANAPCDNFREYLKHRHLRTINFGQLSMIGRRNKRAFESLRHKFIRLGLS